MARITDPKCKQCRRAGEKLYLKGDRCFTPKCPIVKRNYPPGVHGPNQRQRLSEYGQQLREKQKLKRSYGILERQIRNYVEEAIRRQGETGNNLLQLLESRLDNVVYRLGLGRSRAEARQLVSHGHILVNGKLVNIPSYGVRPGDSIRLHTKTANSESFQIRLKELKKKNLPSWLGLDFETVTGKMNHQPERADVDQSFDLQLLVEYFSR